MTTAASSWQTINTTGYCPFDLCGRAYRAARGLPAIPATHVVKWPWFGYDEDPSVRSRTYACYKHAQQIVDHQLTLGYRCGAYRVGRLPRQARTAKRRTP